MTTSQSGRLQRQTPAASIEEQMARGFRRYHGDLLAYAATLVGPDDADDVVQDAMLKGLRRLQDGVAATSIRVLLYGVVFDVAHTHLAKQTRRHRMSHLITGPRATLRRWTAPARSARRHEILGELERHVVTLRPSWRAAFVLVRQQGCTLTEAATALGIREATLRAHLVRATEAMRQRLEAAGFTPTSVLEEDTYEPPSDRPRA